MKTMDDFRAIVMDTETADLDGGVLDLALIEIDENLNQIDSLETLLNPERKISFAAMGVHNITEEMVKDAPTMSQFLAETGNPFDHPRLVVIGHNAAFDVGVLRDVMPERFDVIDTLKLARNLYLDAENHKLQTLRYMFGLKAGEAHRAMGDAVTCYSLLKHIAFEFGWGLWDLVRESAKPLSPETRISFGKHRGSKLKDLPRGYVSWMLKQSDVEPDLRQALEAL